ncbi:monofunctional biosynthetic peptidoglycan transglycosylase [Planktotalea frisia]|jgi:monofunctional biosynthetic peptidoglycan transglycosylase|uniref:Biosynthetic peptidoglycan transglycosylase n=1 Tax=Planktotalea frisia TaxID=696762 RepID=A0A1L9NWD0_9RHOB|nr:monofunctional biosynthetic peptidoglycan transglycosylase [Planktotalea frisia]OJI93531.1 monofunctional biosynthetic peptidoglycan transglycosylase [Planktotalea frisia]PZX27749.1 monofunctional biosynthetic peptidoglycan transglycosylase [Planktotalea frisia]
MARVAKKKPAPKKKSTSKKKRSVADRITASRLFVRRWFWRVTLLICAAVLFWVSIYVWVNPTKTPYMRSEELRIGGEVDAQWVSFLEIAPVMVRSVVAAEDANYCNHWGFDMTAIRAAVDSGGARGASTLSQQVVKNVFLWHGRSYVRKALEAGLTPLVELIWTKQRILEVYLNIAEFDEGVFGVEAAARHYFGVGPEKLSATQAARLAAILPSPKKRSASRPSNYVRKRTRQIIDGAATIRRDGRAACFED